MERLSAAGLPTRRTQTAGRAQMSKAVPILDVRSKESFAAGHAPGAVNVPLEQFAARVHELPPKGSAVSLFDSDPDRLRQAAAALRLRGYTVGEAALSAADLHERGPSRAHLWQPSPFLVEAMDCIRSRAGAGSSPRRALDVACGTGRDAVYLALCGYVVDAIDALPDALLRARDLARRSRVSLNTIEQDLRRNPVLPPVAYDLVTVFRFLHRPLLPAVRQGVAPGGFIVYEAFHSSDAPPGRKPVKASHAATDGELAAAFAGFEVLIARDAVPRAGRVFSQLLARRQE
jgi:tellurite methyltransferase